MANVLAELFGDIAAAIREKTGDEGTMKPIEFPDEIRAIVTGGGDSGESGGGSSGGESGGSGSTDVREVWLSESGIFTPEESTYTVEHSLGKIPDVIYFKIDLGFSTFTDSAGLYVLSFFVMSDNLLGGAVNVGGKKAYRGMTYFYNPSNGQFGTGLLTNGIENLVATDFIHATDTSIRFGSADLLLSKKYTYSWGAYAKRKLEGDSGDLMRYVTFIGANGQEIHKESVIVGDDCPNPVANGTIQTPTKASTVDKVYTFSGWSLTEGGTASSGALKNITADKTVYVAFTESVRTYEVRFYDGETLVKTENVAYGGSSTYRYSKQNYTFTGWSPEPSNITGEMDCYAQLISNGTFATASWERIASVSEAGGASSAYSVGDTKTITFTYPNGDTEEVELQIAALNVDTDYDTGKPVMTLIPKNALGKITSQWHSVDNVAYADFREGIVYYDTLMNTVIPGLPEDLQAVLKRNAVEDDTPFYIRPPLYKDVYQGGYSIFTDNTSRMKTRNGATCRYPLYDEKPSGGDVRYKSNVGIDGICRDEVRYTLETFAVCFLLFI